MKKLSVIASVILTACILLSATACWSERLAPPVISNMSDDYTLMWFAIPDARGYEVEIRFSDGTTEERSTKRTSLTLADLAEGEYELRVRSVGGRKNDVFSEWSQPWSFNRLKESGILYEYINGGAEYTVAGAGTATGRIEIEEFYRNKPVTGIKIGAFRGNSEVTDVIIGPRVVSIENRAFYSCVNLQSVTFPEGIKSIGYSAFQSCTSLQEIQLPASLTELETLVFGYCTGLRTVNFNANLKKIGRESFFGCTALESVEIPDGVSEIGESAFGSDTSLTRVKIGKDVSEIGESAFRDSAVETLEFAERQESELVLDKFCFADTQLESAVLPYGTVTIGESAFSGADKLGSVTIPETVTQVNRNAFYDTALYRAQNAPSGDGLIYADHWLIDATPEFQATVVNLDGTVFRRDTFGIADYAFLDVDSQGYTGCSELYSIDLPQSVKYLGAYSFAYAQNLYRFHALQEDGLISTGYATFAGCTGLVNVRFANGLKTIEKSTFMYCELLDDNPDHPDYLTPESVTRIGQNAFFGTKLYTKAENEIVYAGNWVVGYDYDVIHEIWDLNFDGELPENIVGVADYALGGCIKLERIDLSNIKYIGKSAFTYCSSLSSVQLNYNLMEIAPFTFYKCNRLRNVEFPMNLQKINRYAFFQTGLTQVNLEDTFINTIGEFAFYGCIDMAVLRLPADTLETIEKYAFFDCDTLGSAYLPDSLKAIGERAFADCISLRYVTFGNGLQEIGAHAFRNCAMQEIVLPDSLKTIGNSAFKACYTASTLVIGNNVETIGTYAFANLINLRNVVIPSSVRTIGDCAFLDCTALSSVSLLGKPDYVGSNAFYGNDRLTFFTSFGQDVTNEWGAWNSLFRPVIWNCEFSEEGYVISADSGENGFSNLHAYRGVSVPVREGYIFLGWSLSENADTAEIGVKDIVNVGAGIKLYAVWQKYEPETPEDPGDYEEPVYGYDVPGDYEGPVYGYDDPDPEWPQAEYDIQRLLEEYFRSLNHKALTE